MSGPDDDLVGRRLEALVDGTADPAAPSEQALVAWASAARGPADAGELAGHDAAMLAFRSQQATGRRGRVAHPLVRVGAGVAAVGLLFGGTAAAYTGALPGPLQELAHTVLGTTGTQPAPPEPPREPSMGPAATDGTLPGGTLPTAGPSSPAGPSVAPRAPETGARRATYGRCRAWERSGTTNPNSALTRTLSALAGNPARIEAFCAVVLKSPRPDHDGRGHAGGQGHVAQRPDRPGPDGDHGPDSHGQGEKHLGNGSGPHQRGRSDPPPGRSGTVPATTHRVGGPPADPTG